MSLVTSVDKIKAKMKMKSDMEKARNIRTSVDLHGRKKNDLPQKNSNRPIMTKGGK